MDDRNYDYDEDVEIPDENLVQIINKEQFLNLFPSPQKFIDHFSLIGSLTRPLSPSSPQIYYHEVCGPSGCWVKKTLSYQSTQNIRAAEKSQITVPRSRLADS